MAAIKNILILQKSKNLPDGLREMLRTEGYVAHTVFNLTSAAEKLDDISMGLILIDCGDDPKTTQELLVSLSQETNLCQFPTVLITPIHEQIDEVLNNQFLHASALGVPCAAEDALDAINQLNATFDEYLEKLANLNPGLANKLKQEEEEKLTFIEETTIEFDDASRGLLLREFVANIAEGGSKEECDRAALILQKINESVLAVQHIIPDNARVKEIYESVCDDLSGRKKSSLLRTTLLTGLSAQALDIEGSHYDSIVAAQLLLQEKMHTNGSTLSRSNYLVDRSNRVRKEIAKVLVDCAQDPRIEDLSLASELLYLTSELLRGIRSANNNSDDLSASTILLGDMVERTCFHRGFWDSRGSFQILLRFKNGGLAHLHQKAAMKTVLYLSSFLRNQNIQMLLPARAEFDRDLWKTTLKKKRELQAHEHEREVNLNELGSGMVLSRPLESLDGKRILEAGVELDNDLIFRILELSSIRGLILPLFVVSESGISLR